jgi:hypothetical protein
MRTSLNILTLLLCFSLSCLSCISERKNEQYPFSEEEEIDNTENLEELPKAGFRYSSYGTEYNPGPEYWLSVGNRISSYFKNSTPQCIWIVGVLSGEGTYLNFPVETESELIRFSSTDKNEATFDLFDKNGVEVWLQIEPGNAPVEETIHLMLKRYAHHKCVIGVGVDVEWYKSTEEPDGEAVSDDVANDWLAIAKSYNKDYRLFLKHWLIEKMPPTARKDIVFVDDSQELGSLKAMNTEFRQWAKAFYPAQVSFQVGYDLDKVWWAKYNNPSQAIGNNLATDIDNMEALFWVDFTVLEVFPEE